MRIFPDIRQKLQLWLDLNEAAPWPSFAGGFRIQAPSFSFRLPFSRFCAAAISLRDQKAEVAFLLIVLGADGHPRSGLGPAGSAPRIIRVPDLFGPPLARNDFRKDTPVSWNLTLRTVGTCGEKRFALFCSPLFPGPVDLEGPRILYGCHPRSGLIAFPP
jgi:hypothetical protein